MTCSYSFCSSQLMRKITIRNIIIIIIITKKKNALNICLIFANFRFLEKSNRETNLFKFADVWDIYEEMSAVNDLSYVTASLFATKFMSKESGSETGGTVQEILQRLKSGYDMAVDYFKKKRN